MIGQEFTAWLAGDQFTCLGARASARRSALEISSFGRFGDQETALKLHRSLVDFTQTLSPEENFASFVAVFDGPTGLVEQAFEELLWRQLSLLHQLDAPQHPWAHDVSADPASPHFGFSIAGHAFFIVGMHGGASRTSRRFRLPALAFNSHAQFARLRRDGVYQGMQDHIRRRELRLQGSLKPDLADHGVVSEAGQYAGRVVETDWKCPFHKGVER